MSVNKRKRLITISALMYKEIQVKLYAKTPKKKPLKVNGGKLNKFVSVYNKKTEKTFQRFLSR